MADLETLAAARRLLDGTERLAQAMDAELRALEEAIRDGERAQEAVLKTAAHVLEEIRHLETEVSANAVARDRLARARTAEMLEHGRAAGPEAFEPPALLRSEWLPSSVVHSLVPALPEFRPIRETDLKHYPMKATSDPDLADAWEVLAEEEPGFHEQLAEAFELLVAARARTEEARTKRRPKERRAPVPSDRSRERDDPTKARS